MLPCKNWVVTPGVHGCTGVTSITACLGMILAWQFGFKVLIAHLGRRGDGVEEMFAGHQPELDMNHFNESSSVNPSSTLLPNGWDALQRLAVHGRLNPSLLISCTIPVMRNLDILPGYDDSSLEAATATLNMTATHQQTQQTIAALLEQGALHYDIVLWADNVRMQGSYAGGPKANKRVAELIHNDVRSHLLHQIVVLPQQKALIEQALVDQGRQGASAYVIGAYDEMARWNIANVRRKFKLPQPIFAMPYVTAYRNAHEDGNMTTWFIRQCQLYEKGKESALVKHMLRLAQYVMQESGMNERPAWTEGRDRSG
ncbi:hypothetical protein [Paenibacillus sp. 481]|uniref:hypothetical protein n=1 Tax=Paenibacillus sp. 481 TaxID=2835869 RepID=UPI001E2E2158|nr:hypothetical protein [Paenibacillus sp. 481]UHA73105.1 hypothetical protein KIK04_21305 [Paenibacillus sp. 481]